MVVINGIVFAIVPSTSEYLQTFRKCWDPDWIDLTYVDWDEVDKKFVKFSVELSAAEEIYGCSAIWVCPD